MSHLAKRRTLAVQVACALRLYQPVLIRGSLETVGNVLDESEFVNARGGPQTPMLINASAWQMSNMMLTAMIRDASETSCASSILLARETARG